MASVVNALACCVLAVAFFWVFATLGIIGGGSIVFERVWDGVFLVLSPVFAYLTIYRPKIALAYAAVLVITFVLLIVEGSVIARLPKSWSGYVFAGCGTGTFAFAVWVVRGRHAVTPKGK